MAIIGYAEANYYSLITRGHHYVDRTPFIREMEKLGNRNLLFARPRRFGKSLWVSTLHHYYDIRFKDEFDKLFGKYAIGQNPTPERNSYIMLLFQFSGIDVSTDERAYRGFMDNVLAGVKQCMGAYPAYFSSEDIDKIGALKSPESILQNFLTLHQIKRIPYKIYTLIDEYDHFANELFTLDIERFQNIVSRTGFVRKFYELIKSAMGNGIIDRNFMTGVAPLTVDALTSGFNTVTHLTLDRKFHDLAGFTKAEVEEIMLLVGAPKEGMPQLISDLTIWYDGYLFNKKAANRLYNADMVMYFAGQYEQYKAYPEKILDTNVASDYTKVRKVFMANSEDTTYIPLLKKITTEGSVSAQLTDLFNFEKIFTEYDIISLLFYMGWLTIKEAEEGAGDYSFKIPNRVIQELYYDYFVAISEEEANLNRTHVDIHRSLIEWSKNNPKPFLELIKALIDKQLSMRDAQKFDEKHLKMLLIPYLSLSSTHYVVSEPEWGNGYPDMLLLRRPNVTTKYCFVVELKYLKKADKNKKDPQTGEKLIDKTIKEARQQLHNYLQTDNAKRMEHLKAWLLVLVGRDWHLIEEVSAVF